MITLHRIKLITKPFWIPAITGIYLSLTNHIDPLVITALGFGYIGDLLLMRSKKSWFVAGAISFIIGHIFYIAVFLVDAGGISVFSRQPAACAIFLLPYIIFALWLFKYLRVNVTSMYYAALAYLSILLLMSYAALLRVWTAGSLSFILTLAGSLLFIISDSLISIRKLKRKFRGIGTMIVFTYIAAQILIILGLTAG